MTIDVPSDGRTSVAAPSTSATDPSKRPILSKRFLFSDRQISIAIGKIYGLKVGGAAMAYLVQLTIAFYLGAANYGIFALAWVIATTLGQICCCGFNDSTGRYLPFYITKRDLPRARGFVRYSLWFSSSVSVIFAALAALSFVFARPMLPEDYFLPIFIGLVCVPALTFTHLKESIAVSRSHIFAGLIPTYILRPLLLIIIASTTMFLTQTNTPASAVLGLLTASVMVALIQSRWLAKPVQDELGVGDTAIERSEWLKASLPLFLAQGFFVLSTSVDILVLSFFVQPDQLGIYFAAVKMVALLSFVHVAVAAGLTRRLAESLAQQDPAAFRSQFERGRIWMVIPTLFGASFLVICAPYLLSMFGPEFMAGNVIILILVAGVMAQAAGGPIQEALITTGNQNAVSLIIGVFFAVNLVLSLVLVGPLGTTGVAIASAFSVAGRIAVMCLFARFRKPLLSV